MSVSYLPKTITVNTTLRIKIDQTVSGGNVSVTLTMQARKGASLSGWHASGTFSVNTGGSVTTWTPGSVGTLVDGWNDAGNPLQFTVDRTKYSEVTVATSAFRYWQQYGSTMYYLIWGSGVEYSEAFSLDKSQSYTFTIDSNALVGCTISAARTSSPGGGAASGNIVSGATVYYGDKIKVVYTAKPNYAIKTTTINGVSFVSGNTYSVTSNTTVSATTQILASSVSVSSSSADIESNISINVTRYGTGYYHSLQYSFGSLSGYITSSGTVSSTEVKYTTSSISFAIPSSFYAQIPSATYGICTITCRTYTSSSSSSVLGTPTTVTFKAVVNQTNNKPQVTGSVVDTNNNTVSLTGDNTKLIRYKSQVVATISAEPKNSATISTKKINGVSVSGSTLSISPSNLNSGSFSFYAKDSRGYETSMSYTNTLIPYVSLSINPVVSRPDPTSGKISLTFSGNFYNGNLGAYNNTLVVRYRSKISTDSAYGAWKTVPSTSITLSTSTYRSNTTILLIANNGSTTGFDYQEAYDVLVQAYDGANNIVLSSTEISTRVSEGVPVFEWGKSDFKFNVPVSLNNITVNKSIGSSLAFGSSITNIYPVPILKYNDIDSDTTTPDFLQKWIVKICQEYPNVAGGGFQGGCRPNSFGFIIFGVQNSSDVSEGLPRYSYGLFMGVGTTMRFGTTNYSFYCDTL